MISAEKRLLLFLSSPSHNEYLTDRSTAHTEAVELYNAESLALFACEKTNWETCAAVASQTKINLEHSVNNMECD